ncbi:MAG: ABC transporter ATP-binding protein [Parvibaculum sp.]|uniref:ABC transporter ATP-binding protein n=1 Tax=Parvibaculum sp. TaxID=2024848 RepID=UPI002717913E|nr:ABC transporter ATP-binding protein [Parvibaculum sp.]MDO8839216.1 ABC transporter ATP-binding protein [Parvibaculum sp.]MDP2124757.1 ABC transporter ATP-binding protein [Parvibaculum sp.]
MTLLEVENLAVHFGGIKAVDGVSFGVDKGEIFTIIGPNGAGKSTIFNLVSRIYQPTSGRIRFEGKDITGLPAHRIAGLGIARTFQNIELFDMATVLDNMMLGRHAHRRTGPFAHLFFGPATRAEELAHRRKIEEVIDFLDLQHYRDQMIANLPYGVRKVVELGRALCTEPKILLLDEPSSGLNVEETEDMSFWISDIKNILGITVIMVEHDMNLVNEVSDRVLALNYGRVIATGTPAEVQAHPEVIRAYLGGDDTETEAA